jgi:hypothetical protein
VPERITYGGKKIMSENVNNTSINEANEVAEATANSAEEIKTYTADEVMALL